MHGPYIFTGLHYFTVKGEDNGNQDGRACNAM